MSREEKKHIGKVIVPFKEYASMKGKIKEQKEEIERLNNIIKNGINEELRKELDEILKCNQAQANRIYKAIEYIESYLPNYSFDKTNLRKLLEILRGEE